MVKWFDNLSVGVKVLLLLPFWGWIVAGLYRICSYLEIEKNEGTLIVGILCFVAVIGFVISLIDIFTQVVYGQMSVGFTYIVRSTKEEDTKEDNDTTTKK